MTIIYVFTFLLGASLASFLNATIYRLENGYKYPKIIKVGSHCEKCERLLTWWELIPILGYILTKGRCSECGESINIYYPISELYLGLTFLTFLIFGISWYMWIVILLLFSLSYFDTKDKKVYQDHVHIFLAVCALFFILNFEITNIVLPLVFTIFILVLNQIKKSFATGDLLVLLGLGILISWQQYLVMFWLGILVALLYSLILIVKDKVSIKETKVPMIPFFTISFTVTILYGEQIYEYLLKLMGI
jgi:prepilin signal peptidase PulO-like enzyme (type II secretory pathway)